MTDKNSVVKLLEEIKSTLTLMLVYLGVIIIFLFLILISVASAEQQGHWVTLEEKPMLYKLPAKGAEDEGMVLKADQLNWEVVYMKGMTQQELITILEQARRHVWYEHSSIQVHTLQVDHCVTDPI